MLKRDIAILRKLAYKIKEYSENSDNENLKRLWVLHNKLKQERPMMLVFPEGGWRELVKKESLVCEGEKAREMEYKLRQRIYYAEHLKDDAPLEKTWHVSKVINNKPAWDLFSILSWGLEPKKEYIDKEKGAYKTIPIINEYKDIKKIKTPVFEYNEKETLCNLELEGNILGDILDIKLTGIRRISVHLMNYYSGLRGLDNLFLDMYDNPEMIHDVMAIFENGYYETFKQLEQQNLLSLNNDETYNSTGGLGYSDEIPGEGYDPNRIRIKDIWGCAESQEFSEVSPKMHKEFALEYEKRIMSKFALCGYGCCEPLHDKLDDVFEIANLRRISISPWADIEKSAESLGSKYILSWKPNPSFLCGDFNAIAIHNYINDALYIAKRYNCQMEIVLKDTHTCENKPERFDIWVSIVREIIGY